MDLDSQLSPNPSNSDTNNNSNDENVINVAIVGTGMAGLCAAWLLSSTGRHNVTVYDKSIEAGLGSHSRVVNGVVVDVPLRIVTQEFYPELIRLYKHLGIELYVADSSSSLSWMRNASDSTQKRDGITPPYFRYSNVLKQEDSSSMLDSSSFTRPEFYYVLRDLLWLCLFGTIDYYRGKLSGLTIGAYLTQKRYSDAFTIGFLAAYLAVICSCGHDSALNYPANVVFEYFLPVTLGSQGVYRVSEGVRIAISALTEKVSRHCYSSDISSIHKHSETGKWVVDDKTHGTAEYDHIIVATDPHAAAIILRNISPKLAQTIGQVEVTQSETILHTDESFMPSDSALWSPMNLKSTRTPGAQEQTQTECTAWINALQPISDKQQVFETWNPLSEPREGTVISRSMFDRPLVTMETAQMLHEVSAAQGVEGLWVCGAYTLSGVPLLENAADSGLRVAEKLAGVNRPWEHSLRRAVPSPVHALTAVSANLMRNAAQMTGNGISRAANWSRDCVREMSSIAFKTLPGWSDTPDTK